MKKFIKDLETELKKNNVSESDIQEILNDHMEMINEALSDGLDENELETKFGSPKNLAEEIAENRGYTEEKKDGNDLREKEESDVIEFNITDKPINIKINLLSEDINVFSTDGEKIIIKKKGKRKFSDYIIEFKDNLLTIEIKKNRKMVFGFRSNYSVVFDVYIPEKISIEKFKFNATSGDSNINDLSFQDLFFKSVSGDCILKSINTNDFNVSFVSGDLSLEKVNAEDCYMSFVSGDLSAKEFIVKKNINFNSVSGDARIIDSECDSIDYRTVSGDLSGEEFYPKSVSLKSVSGDITIKNTDKSREIDVKYQKTLSGDIKI